MPWQPPWPPRKNGRRSLASLWLGLGLRHRLPQGREVAWSLHEVQHAVHPKLRVHVWVRTQVMPVVEHHLERHPNLHIPKSAPYIGSLVCCEVPQRPADRNSNNLICRKQALPLPLPLLPPPLPFNLAATMADKKPPRQNQRKRLRVNKSVNGDC